MSFAIDSFNAERFGLVTGSRCTVMFPLKGDGLIGMRSYAKQLANEKFFKTYDERSSWEMEHGKMAEFHAFNHYEQFINKNIVKGDWVRVGECGGTIDAETDEEVIDFKCPTSLAKWLDFLHEPLKKDYRDQLNMYCHLRRKKRGRIAAYLTETNFMSDNGLVYPIPEEKRMIVVDVQYDPFWESKLNENLPFVIQQRDIFLKKLEQTFNA